MDCGNLKQALSELKSMLNTPIKRFTAPEGSDSNENKLENDSQGNGSPGSEVDNSLSDGDLPGQITRVLGKCGSSPLQFWVTSKCDWWGSFGDFLCSLYAASDWDWKSGR